MSKGRKKPVSVSAVRKIFHQHGLQLPRILTLALTGSCNLYCRHCWVDSSPESGRPELPEAVINRLLREFAAIGGHGVRITGGEPLCHPAWLRCLQLVRELGFSQLVLQTNGTLLTAAVVEDIANLDFPGLTIQLSLEGATAASHDCIRGDGTFTAAMTGIQHLVAAGLGQRLNLAFTEMRHNLNQFPQLLQLAETFGIGAVTAGTLVTGGRGGDAESAPLPATIEQYLDLIDQFEGDHTFRESYRQRGNLTALEWWQEKPSVNGCCQFVQQPYITPSGLLYPCLMCHADAYAVTGVFEKPLTDALVEGASLWSTLQQTCRLRSSTIAVCQSCPERNICAAGCPGRALGSSGDLQAPDDRCGLRQAIARKRLDRKKTN